MQLVLYQIAAVARTEFRVQWRRRALLVMTLAMLVVSGIATLLLYNEVSLRDKIAMDNDVSTSTVVSLTLIPMGAVLALVMPFVMADVVPKDCQLGVRELLDTTPLPSNVYLAGKVLGALLSVFSSVTVIFFITGVLWRIFVASYQVSEMIEAWLVGALLTAVINIGLIVLLAATQPNAQRAVLVAIVVFALIPGILGFEPTGDLRESLNPLRPGIFFHYTDIVTPDADQMAVVATGVRDSNLLPVSTTAITGLAQAVCAWIIMGWWIRRREAI